jgi:hypothetical protein
MLLQHVLEQLLSSHSERAGLTTGGIGVVAFTLDCEVVGASWRGCLGIFSQNFWALGACMVPLLAVAVPDWRAQTVACAGTLVAMVPLFPFIPESPRWLLSQVRMVHHCMPSNEQRTAMLCLLAFFRLHASGCRRPNRSPIRDLALLLPFSFIRDLVCRHKLCFP